MHIEKHLTVNCIGQVQENIKYNYDDIIVVCSSSIIIVCLWFVGNDLPVGYPTILVKIQSDKE